MFYDADVDGEVDRKDNKCLLDLDLLEVVIRACPEQAANVCKVVLCGFVVAESATYIVQGSQYIGVRFDCSLSSDVIHKFRVSG